MLDTANTLNEFIGKIIKKIEINKDENEIIFIFDDDKKIKMFHFQDRREHVYIKDICGDIEDLLSTPIVMAEERTHQFDERYGDSFTWSFYVFRSKKGNVTITWYGTSNGYYSEGVDIEYLKD